MRKRIVIAVAVILIAGTLAAVKTLRGRASEGALTLSGTIEADDIQVGSRLGGRVAEVLVREGDRVVAGQTLVRFESADLGARRADAEASVARAEAALAKALNGARPEELAEARAQAEAAAARLAESQNGPRPQEIAQARAQAEAAEADLRVAQSTYERVENLAADGIVSRQELDEARGAYERARGQHNAALERLRLLQAGTRSEEIAQARKAYDQARARQRLLEEGTRPEDIAAARAELERAKAGLERIATDTTELEVRAPADAFVEVLQVRPGDLLAANAPVATLVELDRLWVRVYVPEPELGNVALGDEVAVTVDTFPDRTFAGRIEQIASKGEFTPRNVQTREERNHQVFAVRVRLVETDRLRPGMAADVAL